jgi:ATP-binding cassette, subfamily B, bacterial
MLRRFFAYYAPYKHLFFLDFGCAVLAGILELGFPLAVKLFVDELLPGQNWGLIAATAALLLGVFAIETDMRRQAFDHIQKLSFRYFDNNKTGQLITHVTKDLEEVGEVAHHGPEDLFIAVMTFIGAFVLMFTVHWQLALLTTIIVPLMTWLVSKYGSRMTTTWQQLFRQVGDFNTRVQESVGGIRVVKAFANEDYERGLFAKNNEGYRATKLSAYAIMTASIALSYFSTRFVQLVVMVAGTWFVIAGELSYGGFVSFLLLVNVFFRPIDKITSVLESYPKGIAGFRRFTTLIDTEPDTADRPGAKPVASLKGDIVYNDVSFAYSGDPAAKDKVLDGLNLSIAAGETRRLCRPVRCRQDHHLFAPAALLRRHRRRHQH